MARDLPLPSKRKNSDGLGCCCCYFSDFRNILEEVSSGDPLAEEEAEEEEEEDWRSIPSLLFFFHRSEHLIPEKFGWGSTGKKSSFSLREFFDRQTPAERYH